MIGQAYRGPKLPPLQYTMAGITRSSKVTFDSKLRYKLGETPICFCHAHEAKQILENVFVTEEMYGMKLLGEPEAALFARRIFARPDPKKTYRELRNDMDAARDLGNLILDPEHIAEGEQARTDYLLSLINEDESVSVSIKRKARPSEDEPPAKRPATGEL